MPELPEVLTIKNDLQKEVVGREIVKVKIFDGYRIEPSTESFVNKVINQKITEVDAFAKLLLIKLSSGDFISTHLRMSGLVLFNNRDPYVKISLTLDNGDELNYSSVRMFGFFEAWAPEKVKQYIGKYGKSALDEGLEADEFKTIMSKRKAPIKNALLNQNLISGVGNIYANDALYLSGIHPKRKSYQLSDDELMSLFLNIRRVLNEGIKNRGSSIDRFRDIYGKPGSHQDNFHVYGSEGTGCTQCDSDTIVFEKMSGRGTFYCPTCQKPEQPSLF